MAAKTKVPVDPQEPLYDRIEKYGTALRKGWLWLIILIWLIVKCWDVELSTMITSGIAGSVFQKAISYVFKYK